MQVISRSGHFIQAFGDGKIQGPSGLCIVDKYVYVSDVSGHCIVVYETSWSVCHFIWKVWSE